MLDFFEVKNSHDKRLLGVLVLIEICVFQFYFTYGRKIDLVHWRHEILILVGACRHVGKLHNLENWSIETLGTIVTL